MHQAGIAKLWTATYKGQVLAAWIIFVYDGVMYYPYGASSREHREVMAPNLLLWELIKWENKKKLNAFDLWGAIGPPPAGGPDPKTRGMDSIDLNQVSRPNLLNLSGLIDLVIQPILYKLYCLADTVRWSVLKLLK